MGRAIGLASTHFSGVRVAGQLSYVVPHTKNGKAINSRVNIPVYMNSHRGTNSKTGEKGRTDSFKLVAWGKLADVCCRSLSKGKAIDCICTPQSFEGQLFNIDRSLRVDNAGQPITTNKTSFTIKELVFGEESQKQIDQEIQEGRRPIYWNQRNHQHYQAWIDVLVKKQALMWDGHSNVFGYARVIIPQGPGIQVTFNQPAQQGQAPQQFQNGPVYQSGPVYPNAPQYPNAPSAPLPNMVHYAVNQQPVQRPDAPVWQQPVQGGPAPSGHAPMMSSGQQLF